MSSTHSSIVNAPLDDVFAWHARPGAITRLTPPWLPVRVVAEAASLRDGHTVLALPGGLRWDTRHDPGAYDPPRRFADELASMPLRAGLTWRHVHEFRPVPGDSTQVTDTISRWLAVAIVNRSDDGKPGMGSGGSSRHVTTAGRKCRGHSTCPLP